MIITSIETFATEYVALVRVRTDDGDEGWGQVSPYNADITAEVLHRQVACHVLGMDAQDIDAVTVTVLDREHKFQGTYLYRALCGVDTALWDIRGKRAGKSVQLLLGGNRSEFPVYASSMKRDITPQQEAERMLALRERFGYHSFKFRIARECGHDVDQWPGRTEEIVRTIRETLGDDVTLMVDANSGYTPKKAIEVGRMLTDYGVSHYEEPCPYWELDWTREVSDALNIDVSGGEQDNNMIVWKQMIDTHAVDIVQPDICYMGGITRTLQVANYAKRAGIPCTLHSANLSLVTLFSVHFMAAIENAGKYVEFSIEGSDYYPWQNNIFAPGYEIRDGNLLLSSRPGWGIDIDPEWIALSQHRVSYHGSRF
ncbi:MAG: mandelate racemase/muconate lactonizing enzyme family protein [Gammaproteobacteria bacterium]|nr:mandelate racemase/muconate lactonizing enzyme family protein [Gammaproteobacteria bacterium]